MPSLLSQVEDAVVTLLTPLKLPALGGEAGGYLEALELYQGDLAPVPDDPDLNRVLDGRSPAVLVSTGDSADYENESISREVMTENAQIVLIVVANNDRSREAAARGDDWSTDPGAYEIVNDVRARLQGLDSGVAGAGRFSPSGRSIIFRGDDKAIHTITFDIDLDALPYEDPTVGEYTTLRQQISDPEDSEFGVVVEGDTEPGLQLYGQAPPVEVTGYRRSSPASAVTSIGATGPLITEFAANRYAYGYDAAFAHASKLGALFAPPARNLLEESGDLGGATFTNASTQAAVSPEAGPLQTASSLFLPLFTSSTRGLQWRSDNAGALLTVGLVYCFSFYLRRAAEAQQSGGSNPLDTLTLEVRNDSAFSVVESSEITLPGNWARYSIAFEAEDPLMFIRARIPAGTPSGALTFWLPQAVQLELGDTPTDWIRTEAGATAERSSTALDFVVGGRAGRLSNTGSGLELSSGFTATTESQLVSEVLPA